MGRKIIKTNHSIERGDERINWDEKTLDRLLPKVLEYGVTHLEATGRLKKYFSFLYLSHEKQGNNIHMYGRFVFIFQDSILITILPLQKPYYDAVSKIQKRKEREAKHEKSSSGIGKTTIDPV